MNFEWDERKNEINISKHGFDFADASRVFDFPMVVDLDDREDYGEERWVGTGWLDGRVVVVVYTEPDQETIRIISLRKHFLMSENDMSNTSRTDWSRIDAMTDDDIDTSDIPPLSDEFFAKAKLRLPSSSLKKVTIRVDADTLAWFQLQGEAAEQRMAAALRIYAEAHKYTTDTSRESA